MGVRGGSGVIYVYVVGMWIEADNIGNLSLIHVHVRIAFTSREYSYMLP